jgi:cytochrome c peroxidase
MSLSGQAKTLSEKEADSLLDLLLKQQGFTGQIEARLPELMGRSLDPKLVDLGKLIFFDSGLGLHKTNSCAGCHSPTRAFGDTQPIAIGVLRNHDPNVPAIVGPGRKVPDAERNQRRSPALVNVGFYPSLMWNGRFSSNSGNPFDNKSGFSFPLPEGTGAFPPGDSRFPHLLVAQSHIPFTELPEMAGFGGLRDTPAGEAIVFSMFNSRRFSGSQPVTKRIMDVMASATAALREPIIGDDDFKQFDDLPRPISKDDELRKVSDRFPFVDSRNGPIRQEVSKRINSREEYRLRFSQIYPGVSDGNAIEFYMTGQALSEFQLSLSFANAPIDQFARGDRSAMGAREKQGAILFFGRANCVSCHATSGRSNEMFSDFLSHNAGIPAIAPIFGAGKGNVPFRDSDGVQTATGRYDMGLFDMTLAAGDRFKFRTSPLRNVGLQPHFFHNGTFNDLEKAIAYHVDPQSQHAKYDPAQNGVPADLQNRPANGGGAVLNGLAPQLDSKRGAATLTPGEIKLLAEFLDKSLTDERARPARLIGQIPARPDSKSPMGLPLHTFQ